MVSSISWGLSPSPTESDPWGSKSTSSTLRPYSASAAPRLIVVVVLPTPPFWLHMAITRAGPCSVTGGGSGRAGQGRPVGPSSGSAISGGSAGSTGGTTNPSVAGGGPPRSYSSSAACSICSRSEDPLSYVTRAPFG